MEGGADAVIDAFLQAVGPSGTVAVPTLCQRHGPRRFETWNILTSPPDVGRITETLRQQPGAWRSDHPTHSVAAIGLRAEELVRDHARAKGRLGPWGDAAFARDSPWDKLCHWNAMIMFIGVDFSVNTMQHYIQSLIVERALEGSPTAEREALAQQVRGWRCPGIWPDYDDPRMEPLRRDGGLLRYGTIGSATVRLIRAGEMVRHAQAELEATPEDWLAPDCVRWLSQARGSGL